MIRFQRNTNKNNTVVSAAPLFLFTSGEVIIKLLQISTKKYIYIIIIAKRIVDRMNFKTRKQSIAWMEHGLQISLKTYALSMEDKMAAGAFGRAANCG